jgi:hypothetical protein
LFNRRKPALEEIRTRLAAWSVEVPARAARFHTLRSDLDQQVTAALSRWLGGPNDGEMAALLGQMSRLGVLASSLATLVHQAEALETEILDLRSTAERLPDRETREWLTGRCVGWQSTVRRLAANVEREAELEQDQESLQRLRDVVRSHGGALRRLADAHQLLARLGNRMETAALQADLPLLRERLLAEGASPAWRADLESALSPVELVAADFKPRQPPVTLQQVPPLLHDIRRWVRVLGIGEDREIDLKERQRLAESEWEQWSDAETGDLLRQSAELLAELQRTASERRAAVLAPLRERRMQLAAACGPDADLDRHLEALERSESAEPETWEEWMEWQAGVDRLLRDAAGAHILDLEERILQRQGELVESIAGLHRGSLSSRVAGEVERLILEIQGLPDPRNQDVEGIFRALGTCDRVALALDRLHEQARADREAQMAFQMRLLARHQALREQVERTGIEVEDLGPRIAVLAEAGPGTLLDDLRQAAESIEVELAAREKELAARCALWIAGRLPALRERRDLFARAGLPTGETLVSMPAGAALPQAADTVVALRAIETESARRLTEVQARLDSRRLELLVRLGALPVRALRPEVRREVAQAVRGLEERSWKEASGPERRAAGLLDGLELAEALLDRLSQEDREVRERAEALRTRLRTFGERDLDRFCPEDLVSRASALVEGLPVAPPSWSELAPQLDAGEELLAQLEDHAKRVMARRLERVIPQLELQAAAARDPAYAGRLRSLMAEVAALDERDEVPAGAAARILTLARDRTGGKGP